MPVHSEQPEHWSLLSSVRQPEVDVEIYFADQQDTTVQAGASEVQQTFPARWMELRPLCGAGGREAGAAVHEFCSEAFHF